MCGGAPLECLHRIAGAVLHPVCRDAHRLPRRFQRAVSTHAQHVLSVGRNCVLVHWVGEHHRATRRLCRNVRATCVSGTIHENKALPRRAVVFTVVIERARKCLDFSVTMYFVHFCVVWGYSELPKSWDWWLVMCLCAVGTTLLGERARGVLLAARVALLTWPCRRVPVHAPGTAGHPRRRPP